jgi:CRP-like cAMP-binding protein
LTGPSIATLAEQYPNDLKTVLERMLHFAQRYDDQQEQSWWCESKTMRFQAWFKDSNEEFLQELIKNLRSELYLPGEVLVLEGDAADSTMLLECGTASIDKADSRSLYASDRIGDVHDGFWLGEMAMFAGEAKRKATVKATTVCKVQRLYNKELVRLLGSNHDERQRFRQLAEHRLRAVEKEQLEDHDFFKGFDRVFINLLRQKCRAQVFFADETLMVQGEPADSLFILGQDSYVTLSVDGVQIKELMGRACLGTKALLSSRPVKRATTVVTQTVCAVRTLSREDWLDALKLHPEHQKWLATFTKDQLRKVCEARSAFTKKRAWEKIHQRECAATAQHCDRLADPELYVRARHKARGRRLPGIRADSKQAETPQVDKAEAADTTEEVFMHAPVAQALPETWECFNGTQVTVPHTKLPQLNREHEDCPTTTGASGLEERPRVLSDQCDQAYDYDDCLEALSQFLRH